MTSLRSLETRHALLRDERMKNLAKACEHAHPAAQMRLIEVFNADPYYEHRFSDIESQIREIDPTHHLLEENQ